MVTIIIHTTRETLGFQRLPKRPPPVYQKAASWPKAMSYV